MESNAQGQQEADGGLQVTLARASGLLDRFERYYGEGPGHLLAMALGFSLAGYVLSILAGVGHHGWIAVWVGGAIVGHDLVLFPLYSSVGRMLESVASRRHAHKVPMVPWLNHVRAPLLIAAILLFMTFPLVFQLGEATYHRATGLTAAAYLERYLVVVAVLGAGSAAIYVGRVGLVLRRRRVAAEPAILEISTPSE